MFERAQPRVFRPMAKIQASRLDRLSSGLAGGARRVSTGVQPRKSVHPPQLKALEACAPVLGARGHESPTSRLASGSVCLARVQARRSNRTGGALSIGRSVDAHPVESLRGSRYTSLSHGGLTSNSVARSEALRLSIGTSRIPDAVVVRSSGSRGCGMWPAWLPYDTRLQPVHGVHSLRQWRCLQPWYHLCDEARMRAVPAWSIRTCTDSQSSG